jgi:4-amino-4-deoxy-L-arabinose transferase-like glycosyltransferase
MSSTPRGTPRDLMSFRNSLSPGRLLPIAAIALLIGVLTINRLGASDVCGGSEATMAVFVQQMVEHGELLFPLDNCHVPMYKPPLFHWTSFALDKISGHDVVTAFNLRLPSALYAIAGAILTMLFAAALLGTRGAILSGLILAGSFQFVSQGRIGLVDMTLTFFEALALYSFFWWFSLENDDGAVRTRRALHYVLAIAMGLGVLAKGPVGAILPGAAILVFLAWERRWRTLGDIFKPGPLIVGGALAVSWYVACLVGRRYSFLQLQLGSENFGRFFGSLGAMTPWYYLQPILLNSIPLSLLVPIAVVVALTTQRASGSEPDLTSDRAEQAAKFLAIFWIVTVVFFNFAAYKRRDYLLPLWPPAALLLAWWVLARLVPRLGMSIYRGLVAVSLVLALVNYVFIPAYELRGCAKRLTVAEMLAWPVTSLFGRSPAEEFQPGSYRDAATQIDSLVGPDAPLYDVGIDGAKEPLIFYLRRCTSKLPHPLDAVTNGYVIEGPSVPKNESAGLDQFQVVRKLPYGSDGLTLLQHKSAGAL